MTILRNTLWLMVAQGAGMLGPFIMVPFLARALGPQGWAPILAAQALAAWLIMVLDYSSDLSGTREIARARHGDNVRERVAEVIRGVQGAKLLLAPLVTLIALLAFTFVPVLNGHRALMAWTLAYVIFRGLNPMWYFQGVERVRFAAVVDATARAAGAATVIVIVRNPDDGWLVLAVQALFALAHLVLLTVAVAREAPLLRPTIATGTHVLRGTWPVFGIRAVGGVYTQASTLLLGVAAAPAVVAIYGGADRIIRAAISALHPVTQAVLPRVSYLQASDPKGARALIDQLLVRVGLFGVFVGAAVFVAAGPIVQLLLGDEFSAAVPVLRVLAVLPPIIAVSTVLWAFWAVPLGKERLVLASVVLAAAVNLALVWLLTPTGGALGMCVAVIASEVVVLAYLAAAFRRRSS